MECLKILVVDDNADQQLVYKLLFVQLCNDLGCQFEITNCSSSTEAINHLERLGTAALVILDLELGEGKHFDGLELLQKILALRPDFSQFYFILSDYLTHSVNTSGEVMARVQEITQKTPGVQVCAAGKLLTPPLTSLIKAALM